LNWPVLASLATLRVVLAGAIVIVGYPMLLLPRRPEWSRLDRTVAAMVVGMGLAVAIGHLLSPLRLFEPLGVVILALFLWAAIVTRRDGVERLTATLTYPLTYMMNLLDARTSKKEGVAAGSAEAFPTAAHLKQHPETDQAEATEPRSGPQRWLLAGLGLAWVLVALWTRFSDALYHPAPPHSDFPELLQWMKWLFMPRFGIFHDKVYPQGMNVVLAVLHFFSGVEPHTVMRVGGPLLNLFIPAGIWYVVRRSTRSSTAAILAAAIYAGAPSWLPSEFSRQVGTLPQEFTMGLMLPAAWFGYRYLTEGDPLDRFLSAALAMIVAASHWITLLFLAAVYVATAIAGLIARPNLRRTIFLALWVAGGTLAGLLPQGIALAAGKPVLETIATFGLGTDTQVAVRPLPIALAAVLLVALVLMLARVRKERGLLLLPLLMGAFVFIHYLPLLGFNSPAIATRSGDYVAIVAVATVGVGYAALERLLRSRVSPTVATLLATIMILISWFISPPKVLHADMVMSDEMSLQLLRLQTSQLNGRWQVVGRGDTLAQITGYGLQVNTNVWITEYPVPAANVTIAQVLAQKIGVRPEETPDLFFFVEPDPVVGSAAESLGAGPTIRAEAKELANWVQQYADSHPNTVSTWYAGPNLTIYHIPAPGGDS